VIRHRAAVEEADEQRAGGLRAQQTGGDAGQFRECFAREGSPYIHAVAAERIRRNYADGRLIPLGKEESDRRTDHECTDEGFVQQPAGSPHTSCRRSDHSDFGALGFPAIGPFCWENLVPEATQLLGSQCFCFKVSTLPLEDYGIPLLYGRTNLLANPLQIPAHRKY